MRGQRTDYHSGTKNYILSCCESKAGNIPFLVAEEVGEM